MSDDTDRRIAELAIAAAGQVGNNERDWQLRVAKITPLIAAMLRPPQHGHEDDATTPLVTARKVRDASVFRAEYVSHEVEENTKRLIVAFRSATTDDKDADTDGLERMRTEPWWTPAGFVMRKLIESLEPGTPVNVYKHVEAISGAKKVRVLVHLEVAGRPRSTGQPEPHQPRPVDRPAPQQESAPAAAPPEHVSGGHAALVAERREALSPSQRVTWGRLCAQKYGVGTFMDPSDEDLDKVLAAFGEIEKGQ